MKKFHKIAFLVALGMVIIITSCAPDDEIPDETLQSFILAEFQTEQNRIRSEEINPGLEKIRVQYPKPQPRIDAVYKRFDRVNELYSIEPQDLNDSFAFESLKRELLTLRFNYEEPRGNYYIQFDPYNDKGINPYDSADLAIYDSLFEKVAMLDLSFELRKLYFNEAILLTLNYFENRLSFNDDSFYIIDFGVNTPNKIWLQNEGAFITVGYYEDFCESYEIEIANQVFDKIPVQFNLPSEKGMVTYHGKIKIKEAGKEVWSAFELRFFVE